MPPQPFEQTSLLPPTPAEKRALERQRRSEDPCWEALIRATNAHPTMERDLLNVGLKGIRAGCLHEGTPFEDIPSEIEKRAAAYRKVFPNCSITPVALAKHWCRIMGELNRRSVSSEQAAIAALRSASDGTVQL